MDTAVINGIHLGFERVGSGSPVVLAAGTGMPPVVWELCGVRDALVALDYEVITYAARGVAPSQAPPGPYTVSDMADDVAALIEHLEIERCSIVGYSLGGFVAECLARERPELVNGVALIASAGPPTPVLLASIETEASLIAEFGHLPAAYARYETLHSSLPPAVLRDDPRVTDEWWALLAAQDESWTSPDGAVGQSGAAHSWIHDPDRMSRLTDIEAPVLVVAFEHDLYFPPRVGREASARIPLGQFVEIGHAAHAGLMTDTTACLDALLPFLASARSPRP